jgi:hypothetical protein
VVLRCRVRGYRCRVRRRCSVAFGSGHRVGGLRLPLQGTQRVVAGYAGTAAEPGSWALVRGLRPPLQGTQPSLQGTQRTVAGYAPHPPLAGHPVGASVVSGPPRGPRPPGALRATKRVRLVVRSRFLNFAIQNSFAEIGSHRTKSDWRASL